MLRNNDVEDDDEDDNDDFTVLISNDIWKGKILSVSIFPRRAIYVRLGRGKITPIVPRLPSLFLQTIALVENSSRKNWEANKPISMSCGMAKTYVYTYVEGY